VRLKSLLRCTINWCMRCHVLWRKIPRNVMSYDLNVGKQFSCNISTHNENSPYSPNSSCPLSHTSLDPSKLRIEMIRPLQLAKLLPSVQRLIFCKNVGLCIALRAGWRSRYFRHRGSFFCSANSAPLHGMHLERRSPKITIQLRAETRTITSHYSDCVGIVERIRYTDTRLNLLLYLKPIK